MNLKFPFAGLVSNTHEHLASFDRTKKKTISEPARSQSRRQWGYELPESVFLCAHTAVAAVQDFQFLDAIEQHGPPFDFSHRWTDLCLQGVIDGSQQVALRSMPSDRRISVIATSRSVFRSCASNSPSCTSSSVLKILLDLLNNTLNVSKDVSPVNRLKRAFSFEP